MRHLFYLFFLLMSLHADAKEYPMLHYGIEDGLPSNTIYDVYQDADGFIWIGTDKGVVRYNGQQFETFSTEDGLPDNECFFFQPDYNGRLWISTFNGELCYYKDGVFHNSVNTPFLRLPSKASVTLEINLHADSSLTVYFHDDPGFYEIKGEKITHFLSPFMEKKFADYYNKHIDKNQNGLYDIYYRDEKVSFTADCKVLSRLPYNNFILPRFIYNRGKGYFVTDKNGIYTTSLEKIDLKGLAESDKSKVYKIYRDGNHEILATSKGLIFDGTIRLLPEHHVHYMLKDREGNYWVATAQNGLYKFSHNFQDEYQINAISTKPVIFSKKLKNEMLFTTKDRSTFLLNMTRGTNKCLLDYTKFSTGNDLLKSVQWLDGDTFFNFSEEDNFKIYGVSTPSPTVKQLKTGNFWGSNKHLLSGNYHFFKTPYGIFHFSKEKFLNPIGLATMGMVSYHKYLATAIYAFAQDKDSVIWFSTIDSVFRIKDTNVIIQPQFGKSTFREFVFCNNYFLGITHGNQLLISNNYKTAKVSFDTIKNNNCTWDKFYVVNDSVLLISTSNYFRVLNLHQNSREAKFSVRLIEDRMIPYQPDHLMIDDDRCYFFKSNNLYSFSINYLLKKEVLPLLKFISLKTAKKSYSLKDSLCLDYYDSRSISIRFAPISFTHHNLVYEYSVEQPGQPENWIAINSEDISLFKLGYGTFSIKLRAKTMSGEYSNPVSFILRIDKPFWATFWFIGLTSLISIIIIGYVARLGIKRNLKKKESEIRFLKSEYKALNAMMNPHFIFNSLNSVQGLINNKEIAAANEYIIIFSDLIRQNMHNTSKELITLKQELTLVENYIKIEQLRLNGTLMYSIDIDEDIEEDAILIPPLLIQPLVENAIKHGIWPNEGENGIIEIEVYEEGNILFIEIKDNGIGLIKGQQSDTLHQSYAMSNIHQRLEQLSKIHNIAIKVELNEMIGREGEVLGAKSLISIQTD